MATLQDSPEQIVRKNGKLITYRSLSPGDRQHSLSPLSKISPARVAIKTQQDMVQSPEVPQSQQQPRNMAKTEYNGFFKHSIVLQSSRASVREVITKWNDLGSAATTSRKGGEEPGNVLRQSRFPQVAAVPDSTGAFRHKKSRNQSPVGAPNPSTAAAPNISTTSSSNTQQTENTFTRDGAQLLRHESRLCTYPSRRVNRLNISQKCQAQSEKKNTVSNTRQKLILMQKILDLLGGEHIKLRTFLQEVSEELPSLVICREEYVYDALSRLTNSLIHANQRRASFRELLDAFMKGIEEWVKRFESGVKEEFPKFSCYELTGQRTTAAEEQSFQHIKSEKRALEDLNALLRDETKSLRMTLDNQKQELHLQYTGLLKEKDELNIDLENRLNNMKKERDSLESIRESLQKQLDGVQLQLKNSEERCKEYEHEINDIKTRMSFMDHRNGTNFSGAINTLFDDKAGAKGAGAGQQQGMQASVGGSNRRMSQAGKVIFKKISEAQLTKDQPQQPNIKDSQGTPQMRQSAQRSPSVLARRASKLNAF